jgi:hypothetical protein
LKLGKSMMVNSGSKPYFGGGADQELVYEKRVPGIFGDHPHADAMGKVGATEQVFGEQLAPLSVRHHVGMERIEMRLAHRPVVVPPDLAFAGSIAHHEFVASRAPGMHARAHHQRTILGQEAFAASDRFFRERGRAEIAVHSFQLAKAVAGKIARWAKSSVGHGRSRRR